MRVDVVVAIDGQAVVYKVLLIFVFAFGYRDATEYCRIVWILPYRIPATFYAYCSDHRLTFHSPQVL